MVLLAELDLVQCTETIENVSISNYKCVRKSDEKAVDKTFLSKYARRSREFEKHSLYLFYHSENNSELHKQRRPEKIPHFVGVHGIPKYPVTESYAKQVLIIYKDWRTYPTNLDWVTEFHTFINSPECPPSAKLTYNRVVCRHFDKMEYYDPKASDGHHSANPVSAEDAELITLLGLHQSDDPDHDTKLLRELDRGITYKWDKRPTVSTASTDQPIFSGNTKNSSTC